MAEAFFPIITRRAIRRGSVTSVQDLIAAIENFIDGWNDRCQPFTWTGPPTRYSRNAAPGSARVRRILHVSTYEPERECRFCRLWSLWFLGIHGD